jgi:hypothetical protein
LINRDDDNHLLLPPHAGSVGNVKGAEHSGAFISTLDIGKAGGYPAGQPGAASELEKFFLNNATSILTDSDKVVENDHFEKVLERKMGTILETETGHQRSLQHPLRSC